MASGSKKVIIAALLGNSLIAVTKFIAWAFTGSSSMFSEAIHSLVDTSNQGLLLFGIKRAKRPADARHPFGYGGEIYFWSFMVAVLVFGIGAGFSIYEGIHKLQNPEPIKDIYINYIVLSLAIVFESIAFIIAIKEFNKVRGQRSYISAIAASKDPSTFTVLLEDFAALTGLFIALAANIFVDYTGILWVDAAASIIIGVVLGAVAIFMAYECKGLLLGEAASPEIVDSVHELLAKHTDKASVNEVLTVHFGPESVLLTISLDFNDAMSANDVEEFVSDIEQKIKQKHCIIKRIFIEAQNNKDHLRLGDNV